MKVLVVGLDAATFDLIELWVSQGYLPTFAELISGGVSGRLKSTTVPNTFPGWTSCFSGTNEGKHGVFCPLKKVAREPKFSPMSSFDVGTKRLWDLLSERGLNSIVVNMPLTYPVAPLKGILLSGMLTPSLRSPWTYPEALKGEILSKYNYMIDVHKRHSRDLFRIEARTCIETRANVFKYLLTKYPWDFAAVNFSTLDRVQHEFWADMDPSHHLHNPRESDKFGQVIRETYEQLDRIIEDLLSHVLSNDTLVMIVSDHGAGPDYDGVYVNTWLMRHHLLRPTGGWRAHVGWALDSMRELKNTSLGYRVFSVYRLLHARLNRISEAANESKADFSSQIDWTKTLAYFSPDRGGIWLNLKGREKYGIVDENDYDRIRDEVAEILMSWKFPETGERVFGQVIKREEAFDGQHVGLMPDLVPIPSRDSISPIAKLNPKRLFMKPTWCSGAHSTYGVLMATGTGIRQGIAIRGAELKDIAPTILYAMGLPLTNEMDGKVLMDIFTKEFATTHKVKREGSSYLELRDIKGFSEPESALIEERLRGLGYIA